MRSLLAQIAVFAQQETTTTAAGSSSGGLGFPKAEKGELGNDLDKFIEPVTGFLSWLLQARLLQAAVIVAGIIGVWAMMSGNRNRAIEARGRFFGIIQMMLLIVVALAALGFILNTAGAS